MTIEQTAARQDGVVSYAQAREQEVTEGRIRAHLRRGRWFRVRHGAYFVVGSAEYRSAWVEARAVALTIPAAVIAGSAAAGLYGIPGAPTSVTEVIMRRGQALRTRDDLLSRTERLPSEQVVTIRGIRLTSLTRTVEDLVVHNDRLVAIGVCDAVLHRGLLTREELLAVGEDARGRPGSRSVADIWALADGRAESVHESRIRLRCVDGGLPPDELQIRIRDEAGIVRARGDLGYRKRRRPGRGLLVVEADGAAVHGSADAAFRDRAKGNFVTGMGHDLLRFTWQDSSDALTVPRAVWAAL
jgi:hypothetical protein